MCTENESYREREKKLVGGGGQGRCEQEVKLVKINKKKIFWGGGGGIRVDVNGQVKLL